ncbi:MAG: putative selenate reductase subunit YgfK [Ignavibacteriales bacterium]|nr:putative selenate reductase subunit YgfK [Ignavibacteriales bacterium]
MRTIEFHHLLNWIFNEYKNHKSIFGIPSEKFFFKKDFKTLEVFGELLETPIGPAAGPHTQLAQNIISAFLTGGRFFELKTVQILDNLEIDKPCIDAEDEGYNVEWSQELSLGESYDEYIKAWILIHLLNEIFHFSPLEEKGFIFNMSVGYDLKGIKSPGMDTFINQLKDASINKTFNTYKESLLALLKNGYYKNLLKNGFGIEHIFDDKIEICIECLERITPNISNSVTLSTMHGCPPDEIEAIAKYLIKEKGLHTYVKLNPTLLGYEFVENTLRSLGYKYVQLDKDAFNHDLQFTGAVPMLNRLKEFAKENNREFGVKLSNTLGMKNKKGALPGSDMYMSGRALYPLTINLASKLASEFNGDLNISFSGGGSIHNAEKILSAGIYPITFVTDLLKPGGYNRLYQITEQVTRVWELEPRGRKINFDKLKSLAEYSLTDIDYRKDAREINSIKVPLKLPQLDCYIAPCQEACPIHQDVAEYIQLIEENRFEEAFEVVTAKNPLPHITGYICDHQCMYHCTRWDYESPVLIRDLKKIAAEKGFPEYLEKLGARSQKSVKNNSAAVKVAVIGSGPSGLAAGYFLAKSGFEVTIFEKTEKAGGTVQHVIPNFRLPQDAIDKDIEFIKLFGVKFEFGISSDFSLDELRNQGFKYFYLAIGAGKSRELKLAGNNKNVLDAISFLKQFHKDEKPVLGKTVAVVGGGNSAMDGARAAIRCCGVEKVYIIYRRTKEFMPADKEEFDAAINDGVIFKELLLPVEFSSNKLQCQKMILGGIESDGRRKVLPAENEFTEIEVDSVISAIGEVVELDILKKNNLSLDKSSSIITNNTTNETELENVFIGGDALRGPATVVEAIADGKKTADAIIRKENIKLEENYQIKFDLTKREKTLIKRKGVVSVQSESDLILESSRCLSCNFICNKCVEVCPNRSNIAIEISDLAFRQTGSPTLRFSDSQFKDKYQILHIDGMCNECGNCETFCPYTGAPYKNKFTLFWSDDNFNKSKNDGFYLRPSKSENIQAFKIRLASVEGEFEFDKSSNLIGWNSELYESAGFSKYTTLILNIYKNYSYLLDPTT